MDPFTRYVLNRVVVQTLLVLAILVFGFLLVAGNVVRWDLTEDQRYTISEASHKLAAGIEDQLTIRAYFSAQIPPRYEPFQQQVFDILAEYAAQSGGRIKVERFDPDESKAAKDEAANYNIRTVPLPVAEATSFQVTNVYGSIVLLYRDQSSEVIDIASRYTSGYEALSALEYEISSRIWQLANDRPRIGLAGFLSSPAPSQFPGAPPSGPPTPEYQGLRRLLGEEFEIEDVDLKSEEPDPEKVSLLMLVRPKEMSDVELFRLDQFLLKGGRVLIFVTQGTIQSSGFGSSKTFQNIPFRGEFAYKPFSTGLDAWLEHNGLRIPNEFVMHQQNANPIRVPRALDDRFVVEVPEPNWFWPIISSEIEGALNQDNPAVQTLRQIVLFWSHPIDILENKLGSDRTATVLVRSHEAESWRWKNNGRIDYRALDPRGDLPDPGVRGSSPLVVAVEGRFESYFADRPVPPSLVEASSDEESEEPAEEGEEAEEAETGEAEGEKKAEKAKGPVVVKVSKGVNQLVLVGNAFFISDRLLGGQQADERARQSTLLAFNLVDWLARSKDLIALRAKQYSNRNLVEKGFDEAYKRIQAEYDESNRTLEDQERAKAQYDEAKDERKRNRKFWRWANTLIPWFLILASGALVWIVRAARRASVPSIPEPVEPSSIATEE